MKKRVTRRETRERLKEFRVVGEFIKILKKYFPGLLSLLNSVKDNRDKSRTTYDASVIFFTRIIGAIFELDSMRKITTELNDENVILNVAEILNKPDLVELPHYTKINDFLETMDPSELEKIVKLIVKRLMTMDIFKQYRYKGKYWQVIIDGVYLYQVDEENSDGALFKVHKNKDKTIKYVEYYRYVVEAKLRITHNIVISVLSVFCENDADVKPTVGTAEVVEGEFAKTETAETSEQVTVSNEKKKQDCELKAFYRMEKELKEIFGNASLCLTMDSLYAAEPVFEICRRNNWKYIIRFKEGKIESLAKKFEDAVERKNNPNYKEFTSSGGAEKYEFLNAVNYLSHSVNVLRYTELKSDYPFIFITNLPINRRNCEELLLRGRARWKIENEGFNRQKNHGYALTHRFSKDYNASKNHYYLIQLAHAISQLYENLSELKELKLPIYRIHSALKDYFKHTLISEQEVSTKTSVT